MQREIIGHMDKTLLFKDPVIRKIFGLFPTGYLVGGYLRDLQRGIRSDDIDFMLREDIRSALPGFLKVLPGTVIEFSKAPTVRVVSGKKTIDFTELTTSLREDLEQRDFTMNAVAWSLELGIIDPLRGISDIRQKRIRAIAAHNFIRDPLRMLRAYRFASEFAWRIDLNTRKMIKNLNNQIIRSASERITLELFRLLNSNGYFRAVKYAFQDGLLQAIFLNENKLLIDNIKAFSRFDVFLKKIHDRFNMNMEDAVSQEISYAGLLRLERLSAGCDISKSRLRVSGEIRKRLLATNGFLAFLSMRKKLSQSELFDQFMGAPWAARDSAILSRRLYNVKRAEEFLNMVPCVSSEKIMEIACLTPGPELGKLIDEIKKMQFLGILKSEEGAVKWLMKRQGK